MLETPFSQRRYARHQILAHFGPESQARLHQATVLVVGAGGLGSPLLTYLASSGIGCMHVLDPDRVDESNLPRQILYETGDIGRLKVEAAQDRLEELNPAVSIHIHTSTFEAALENQPSLLQGVDVVLDGCDQFQSRLAVNAACVAANVPLVSGAILGWHGQVGVFAGHLPEAPCYACLVGTTPLQTEDCRSNGVIAPLGGVIGSMMALETIKLLTQNGKNLHGRLLQLDALHSQWRESTLSKDPACPVCHR